MYETLIKFISSGSGPEPTPTPTPVPGPESVLTQTLDPFGILICSLIAVYALAGVALLFANRVYVRSSLTNTSVKGKSFLKFAAGTVITSIVLTFVLIIAYSGITLAQPSNSDGEIIVTPSINAVVDEDTGEVSIEGSSIYNNSTSDYEITSIKTSLSEGIEDPDSTWNITIGEKDVYSGVAGQTKTIDPSIVVGSTKDVTVNYSLTMDATLAKSLIDKDVLLVSFEISEIQPTPPPITKADVSVDLNGATVAAAALQDIKSEGWEYADDIFTQEFDTGTSLSTVTKVFDKYIGYGEIVPPSGKVFGQWTATPSGLLIIGDTEIVATWADAPSASITGKVVDASGTAVENAQVALWNATSELVGSVLTGKDGTFTLANIPRGTKGVIKVDTAPSYYSGLIYADIIVSVTEDIDLEEISVADKVVITGHLDDPGIAIKFVSGEDTFSTITDVHGNYWLPVYADVAGYLSFDGGTKYISLTYDFTTGASGSHIEFNPEMTPISEVAVVKGTIDPASEGSVAHFKRADGAVFAGSVDKSTGEFSIQVPSTTPGSLLIYNKGKDALYTTNYTTLEAKSTDTVTIPSFEETTKHEIKIDKGTGIIDPDYIPLGYTKNEDNSLSANYLEGCDVAQIISGIDKTKFWHLNSEAVLDGRELIMFSNAKGTLAEDRVCKPCYKLNISTAENGEMANGQELVTVYPENINKFCEHCYYESSTCNNSIWVYNPDDELLFVYVPHGIVSDTKDHIFSCVDQVIMSDPMAILSGSFNNDVVITFRWASCDLSIIVPIESSSIEALNENDVALLKMYGFISIYDNDAILSLIVPDGYTSSKALNYLKATKVVPHNPGSRTFSHWSIYPDVEKISTWNTTFIANWVE